MRIIFLKVKKYKLYKTLLNSWCSIPECMSYSDVNMTKQCLKIRENAIGGNPKAKQLKLQVDNDGLYSCPVHIFEHGRYDSKEGWRKHVYRKLEWYWFFKKKPKMSNVLPSLNTKCTTYKLHQKIEVLWLKWTQKMEMKQNQIFLLGTYSNLTSYLFYQKLLGYFSDFKNQHFSVFWQKWSQAMERKQNHIFFKSGIYSNLTPFFIGHKILSWFSIKGLI